MKKDRMKAGDSRHTAGDNRQAAENRKKSSGNNRQVAEYDRQGAQNYKKSVGNNKHANENNRQTAENNKSIAENNKQTTENNRQTAVNNEPINENTQQGIKPYKKDASYSYTLGAFPTFELIKTRPEQVLKVLVDSSFTDMDKLQKLCSKKNIPVEINNKLIAKISDKENCYVAGIFNKYSCELKADRPHIVLVNPSNMGNLGTILRTAVGFGITDIAIILPGADIYHPKTVRSSMGALFRLNFYHFESFAEYREKYAKHEVFTFMLNGTNTLTLQECPKAELFSLVFGNEATGLDDSFLEVGTSIFIPQSPEVDSLNLTIAVGIGAYVFTNQR